ncbi:hypothetical protein OOZ19_19765 [Saccharopolyspora sp. NFXS83]|uniref:hypothetical protein n=1 Tax=Saccharopolyspora sp. NFXS83 TaxID=2993560 RepID=UPI00224A8854|nr:hypothetical protein [Saccharopolyspora sp. NFXS83]MCX2732484.1 hypothetical protein [Saccharopolyspora sp. NFXS83]
MINRRAAAAASDRRRAGAPTTRESTAVQLVKLLVPQADAAGRQGQPGLAREPLSRARAAGDGGPGTGR